MRVALLTALLVLVAAGLPAARAKGPVSVGCAEHIEGPGVPPRVDRSRDVVRGAMALMGARLLQQHRVPLETRAKVAVALAAGHTAAMAIAPGSRRCREPARTGTAEAKLSEHSQLIGGSTMAAC